MNVAIYTRESGTRKYKPASPRAAYSPNTTFCLRYTQDGKRRWEQLEVKSYKEAQAASLKMMTELITESCKQKPDVGTVISRTLNLPAPRPKPAKPVQPSGELMLDAAIDKYVENVQTKSAKTSGGYRYTLQQFYASSGNLVLANVTTQQLYDFVGYLRRDGLGDRTIHNRVGEVVTFLRHFGIKEVTMRIKYVEQTSARNWLLTIVSRARKPKREPMPAGINRAWIRHCPRMPLHLQLQLHFQLPLHLQLQLRNNQQPLRGSCRHRHGLLRRRSKASRGLRPSTQAQDTSRMILNSQVETDSWLPSAGL
jgi:hypothetical protein